MVIFCFRGIFVILTWFCFRGILVISSVGKVVILVREASGIAVKMAQIEDWNEVGPTGMRAHSLMRWGAQGTRTGV